ncbi:BRO family protein [Intestinimonas butyriciproducens]
MTVLVTPGGSQQVTIINEQGVYSLILQSKTETAKPIKEV